MPREWRPRWPRLAGAGARRFRPSGSGPVLVSPLVQATMQTTLRHCLCRRIHRRPAQGCPDAVAIYTPDRAVRLRDA